MRKSISWLIALAMVFTTMPCVVFADNADNQKNAGNETVALYVEQSNELLNGGDAEKTVKSVDAVPLSDADEGIAVYSIDKTQYAETVEEAAVVLRAAMLKRQSEIAVNIRVDEASEETLVATSDRILEEATKHTGNPEEGDYLKWAWKSCDCGITGMSDSTGCYITITYKLSYYTTAEEEAALTAAIASLKQELDLEGKTDYETVKAIYDYMVANISYDNANLSNDAYILKYTAYAALINKTAVCQGYATLFYRMALECGIDSRVIVGTSANSKGNQEYHSWNIVKLDGKYYNLDATWDSTWDNDKTNHTFFLKGSDTFENHDSDAEFMNSEFTAAYPISKADYTAVSGDSKCDNNEDGVHTYGSWIIDKAATCTKAGSRHKECSDCGNTVTEAIPATGHSWNKAYTVDKKATAAADGSKSIHCANCNAVKDTVAIAYPKTVKLSTAAYTYDGKVKTPTVKVYDKNGKLIDASNYTATYASGRKNVGSYKVTVTFKSGSKEYSGSKSATFKINPKGTSISSLTKGSKSFTAKWKKQSAKMASSRITGYQLRYSTSSKMKSAKTVTVKGYSAASKKISGLKAKKKYYVQIRTYKNVSGTNYYSPWSTAKSVKTK